MCSTVRFTYRCGCADEVVFKCLFPHLHHVDNVRQDQGQAKGKVEEKEQGETADDNHHMELTLAETPTEELSPPPIILATTMATNLEEECQECAASHDDTTAVTKFDGDDETSSSSGSSDDDQHDGHHHHHRQVSSHSFSPLSEREGGGSERQQHSSRTYHRPLLPCLPPPLPPRLRQQGHARRSRFQHRGQRHGLREIPLNMV
ncbi:hypothetical protein PG987_014519 [Apiospora arundinis]